MSDRPVIPLLPVPVSPWDMTFADMSSWPFRDEFVSRLLINDIPQRIQHYGCRLWGYRDPGGQLVGLGTLVVCNDWGEFTDGKYHTYIPLLAVKPAAEGLGHGGTILGHLIAEAALVVKSWPRCHNALLLDVYTTSEGAIRLYRKNQFEEIAGPFPDPDQQGKEYIVMGRRVDCV